MSLASAHRERLWQLALFFSGRKHADENQKDVLVRRRETLDTPIQMCDALARNLPGELQTILTHCLAHGWRRLVEVADRFPEECRYVLESLAVIYRHDAITPERKLSPSARRHFHQAQSGPVMAQLRVWLGQQLQDRLPKPVSHSGVSSELDTPRLLSRKLLPMPSRIGQEEKAGNTLLQQCNLSGATDLPLK
jgi:transposase